MFVNLSKESNTSQNTAEKKCEECGQTDKKLLRCSQCREVWYCGTKCQGKAWPEHKKVCKIKDETESKPVFYNDFLLSKYSHVFGISSTPSEVPQLTKEQLQDAQLLVNIKSIDAILDRDKTEAYVKNLGQQFFDKYKGRANRDSNAGFKAIQDICNWIAFNTTDSKQDAKKRKSHIECAWDGIGDKSRTWQH